MKLIDQIINTLQTIDLKKRVIEKTENEKGESIKVSIVDYTRSILTMTL